MKKFVKDNQGVTNNIICRPDYTLGFPPTILGDLVWKVLFGSSWSSKHRL